MSLLPGPLSLLCTVGACTNAYTSADETVYELTVPTDRDLQLLDQSFAVLAQFASAIRHAHYKRRRCQQAPCMDTCNAVSAANECIVPSVQHDMARCMQGTPHSVSAT